jgi:DnaJ-class molecular chaperone
MLQQFADNKLNRRRVVEQVCSECDGTGAQPNCRNLYRIQVCKGCNGHGVVLFDGVVNRLFNMSKDQEIVNKKLNEQLF